MLARGLLAASIAFAGQSWASPLATRQTGDACAQAAYAADQYYVQNPKLDPATDRPWIPAELAFQCLTSVPLHTEPAIALVQSLKGYFQVQSTVDYLRKPPKGWLFDPVDLPRGLDDILSNIQNGKYNSEYDLQVDIDSLIVKAYDGHFYARWDLASVFSFRRDETDITLVSVSKDGKEIPKIYLFRDVITANEAGTDYVLTGETVSAVTNINGLDVDVFLQTQAAFVNSQDPDAQYNQVTWTIGQHSAPNDGLPLFSTPVFYAGTETVITFENGTTYTSKNYAKVVKDITGVTSAEELYQKWCVPLTMPSYSSAAPTQTATAAGAEGTASEPPTPSSTGAADPARFPGYPAPHVKDESGKLSGYFLDDKVAVLAIRSFEADNDNFAQDFQNTVEKFLADSKAAGMKKLIIDLMGNGGGFIDLGTDLLAQLFPKSTPDTKSNIRGSTGMYLLIEAYSAVAAYFENEDPTTHDDAKEVMGVDQTVPFAYQSVMTPDAKDFANVHDFYGPHPEANGVFTSFFQTNYTNDLPSQYITGRIDITGYGNRTGVRPQVFDPKDIIVLTDAYCASTCTVVSEGLKNNHGVQFIVMGGRPQTGPMQAVGGVKGSQIFDSTVLAGLVKVWQEPDLVDVSQAKGSPWEDFDSVPLDRGLGGVNGRNHYRFLDTTTTPLQFVYEAADCRIWNTLELMTNITALWDRVATLAFEKRDSSGVINSDYCVKDSTKHATSISGGLKRGELGPQDPPANAKPKYTGYLLDGKKVVQTLVNTGSSAPPNTNYKGSDGGASSTDVKPGINQKALSSIQNACHGYTGSKWFVQLVCGALG